MNETETTTAGPERASRQDRARLLIVDDEDVIRDMLVHILGMNGYETVPAADTSEARLKLGRMNFELALVDIQLPGESGISLLEDIVKTYPDTAVVMVSGMKEIGMALSTINKGAYDYITKPFTPSVVNSCLKRALEKRNLIIENRNYQQNLEKLVQDRTKKLELAIEKIRATYNETIKSLGAALDLRDSDTEDHSRRVSSFSLHLARELEISDKKQLRDLEWGAFLHDIGKIGIPDAILLKPGKLTENEYQVIKKHPELGHRLLAGIDFLRGASELVLSHHEQYDGTGYPMGLKAGDIPLSARIFTVSDTIDAMTSDRPYRKALSIEAVSEELHRMSGKQFDPVIVTAFDGIPPETWRSIAG